MGMTKKNIMDILFKVNVRSTSEPTPICLTHQDYYPFYIQSMTIDGFEVEPANQYHFNTVGMHKVGIHLSDGLNESTLVFGESADRYVPIIDRIIFSDKIQRISAFAFVAVGFRSSDDTYTVEWPSNLKSIGAQAFRWSSSLRITELPASLESIGEYCFSGCYFDYLHIKSKNLQLLGDAVFGTSETYKIYVGDGESAANDNALLAQYLTDVKWAAYSSRLDTWYNFLHT